MMARAITVIEPQILQLVAGRLKLLVRPRGATISRLAPGDRLWVREPFWLPLGMNHVSPSQAAARGAKPIFVADLANIEQPNLGRRRFARELLRIWYRQHLVVTDVQLRPLQGLTDREIEAQGFVTRQDVARAWDANLSMTSDGALWGANPDVLAIAFERMTAPVEVAPEHSAEQREAAT
jgi:hypothetical protein